MGKNVRLVNIYIKLHNKKQLTFDDMAFLAKYDRECFEKTCKNVFYNLPEAKPVLDPQKPSGQQESVPVREAAVIKNSEPVQREYSTKDQVEEVLKRLQKLESTEFPVAEISAEQVKNLIGNLYMEMLFPHDDHERSFDIEPESSFFNKKV